MKTLIVVYVISHGLLIKDPGAPEFKDLGQCSAYAITMNALHPGSIFFCAGDGLVK